MADEDADAAAEAPEAADEATDLPGEVCHVGEIVNHRDTVNSPGAWHQVKWAGFPMKKDWTWGTSQSFADNPILPAEHHTLRSKAPRKAQGSTKRPRQASGSPGGKRPKAGADPVGRALALGSKHMMARPKPSNTVDGPGSQLMLCFGMGGDHPDAHPARCSNSRSPTNHLTATFGPRTRVTGSHSPRRQQKAVQRRVRRR